MKLFENATMAIPQWTGPINPEIDTFPTIILGISSILAVLWWITTWFLYVKTDIYNPDMTFSDGTPTIPLFWMWENLGSSTVGWMAAAYLSFFLGYVFPFCELIGFAYYLTGKPGFYLFWQRYLGLYGSISFLPWGPVFALMHWLLPMFGGGLGGSATMEYALNDLLMFATGFLLYLLISIIHALYGERFLLHYATL